MRLSLPRLKMLLFVIQSILVPISTALKGWVMGSRKRYRQPDHVRSHLTVADLRPRGDWLYHGDLGVNAHRATA